MQHNCIVCIADDGLTIVGPFATREALVAWGDRWQAEHDDDPRWQSLYLANPEWHAADYVKPEATAA